MARVEQGEFEGIDLPGEVGKVGYFMRCEPLRRGRHSKKVVYYALLERGPTSLRRRPNIPASDPASGISTPRPEELHKQELLARHRDWQPTFESNQ